MTSDAMVSTSGPSTAVRLTIRGGVVVVLSFLLGGLTSYAQSVLPGPVAPAANSVSGWTLVTGLLLFWSRLPAVAAAVLGPVSFVLLTIGYAAAADLRGYVYDPLLFSVVGLLAGPFVGLATAWLRAVGARAALGTAALAGIGIGDAVYGLTVVRATTNPAYWIVTGVIGIALVAYMLTRRIRGAPPVVIATAGTATVAAAFVLALKALGLVGLG